jgi:hypothetical protein
VAAGTAAIRIVSATGSDEDLRELARWFRDEEDLKGKVGLAHTPMREGHMGGTLDAVTLVLTSGTAAVAVRSLFNWLGRRREAMRVAITVKSASGDQIDLSCGNADDAERIIEAVRQNLDRGTS